MEIFVLATAVINTLLTAVSVSCMVRVSKKNDALDTYLVTVQQLHSTVRQLDSDVDDLYDRLKRAQSRKGMQAVREERAANPFAKLPTETDGEWKARARRLRNQGVAPITTEEV